MAAVLGAQALGPTAEAEDVMSLPLDEALRMAVASSPLVRQAEAETQAVKARDVGAALLVPSNPVVGGFLGPRRESNQPGPVARGTQFGLHAEQQLEIFNQRGTRRAVVRQAVEAARFRQAVARNETRARTKAAYVASVLARSQAEAALKQEELAHQLLAAVKARVEEGAASDIDMRLAEAELGQVERARLEAEQSAMMALTPLRISVGLPPGTEVSLTTDVARPEPRTEALDQLLTLARSHRAELSQIENSQLELDTELTRLSRETLPNPTVFVDLQRDLPGQLFMGGGLQMPLPVFRRNQGDKALVRAAKVSLAVERDVTERLIGHEVERAFRAVGLLRRQLEVIQTSVLPAAQASVDLLREGWRAGKFDFFRVIQASREVWVARRTYFETLGELWLAVIELDRALGQV